MSMQEANVLATIVEELTGVKAGLEQAAILLGTDQAKAYGLLVSFTDRMERQFKNLRYFVDSCWSDEQILEIMVLRTNQTNETFGNLAQALETQDPYYVEDVIKQQMIPEIDGWIDFCRELYRQVSQTVQ